MTSTEPAVLAFEEGFDFEEFRRDTYSELEDLNSEADNLRRIELLVMLSTSPGPGGANRVLQTAITSAPKFARDLKASLSVPSFQENTSAESGTLVITNDAINKQFIAAVQTLV